MLSIFFLDHIVYLAFSECAHFICNYLDFKDLLNLIQSKNHLTDDDLRHIEKELNSADKVTKTLSFCKLHVCLTSFYPHSNVRVNDAEHHVRPSSATKSIAY